MNFLKGVKGKENEKFVDKRVKMSVSLIVLKCVYKK